jgi:hypothetical protein
MISTTNRKRVPPEFFEDLVPEFSKDEQARQIKELETFIQTKINLNKVIRLADRAINNIVSEVCQIEITDRPSAQESNKPKNQKMNGFFKSTNHA